MIDENRPVKVCTLFSSSAGNSTFVTDGKTSFLIDAGYNMKRVSEALAAVNASICDIHDIFITHSHGDHTAALRCICKRYSPTVRAASLTAAELEVPAERIEPGAAHKIGAFTVIPFRLSHDTAHCVGYAVRHESGVSFASMTDTGCVTEEAREALCGVDAVILESNYDERMLYSGSYPPDVKARIMSEHGHLSNAQAAEFIPYLYKYGTRRILLAHISKENNTPELAYKYAKQTADKFGLNGLRMECADRYAPTRLL